MSVSLHTPTELYDLIIQVLNTRVHFTDIDTLRSWVVTESSSPLDLDYMASFVKVQTRSDETSRLFPILSICHAH